MIEMLTVIAIIGIILAVSLPAFNNLMKSGGVSSASRQISSTLSLARQYAITKRTNVRVVFPYSATFGAGTNFAPLYQSYAVLEYGTRTNYLSKWELLPAGTIFMNINALVGNPPAIDNLQTANLLFPSTNVTSFPVPLAYIEFTPTGVASQTGTFTITEGFVSAGQPTPTSKNAAVLANAVTVTVDNVVGRIRVNPS
jgi:Tfp pilus assembly protein FimT